MTWLSLGAPFSVLENKNFFKSVFDFISPNALKET